MTGTAAEELGRRVRERRLKRGMSQVALAKACGIHDTYLSSIESGRRNVGLDILVRLSWALDVDPGTLVRGIGRPIPD
jgi:transcriptional regulator with XRE-family HTH domain